MAKLLSLKKKQRIPVATGLESLLPEQIHEDVEIEIDNIPTPYANALRRVICAEIPVKILVCDRGDISTDDEFVIPDLICDRISQIPVMQTIPESSQLTLRAKAVGPQNLSVSTGDFGSKYMNSNMEICSIRGGCYIEIKARVETYLGYCTDGTTRIGNVACRVHAVPARDLAMYDQYIETSTTGDPFAADEKRGLRSGYSDEKHYKIKFITLGTMPAETIVRRACEILAEKFRKVAECQITSGAEHIVSVIGESMTIGPPLIYSAITIDPTANMTVCPHPSTMAMEIKYILGEYADPAKFLKAAATALAKFYTDLSAQI
jgi:DNA-directed RNA polymerase subunit L